MTEKELELYIHIPFCVRKCDYCDFLSFPCEAGVRQAYVEALMREIHGYAGSDDIVISIFFGGGTPSLLSEDQLAGILKAVRNTWQIADEAEITLECNPGTADEYKLLAFRQMGINRLSLGLQSTDDRQLRTLGRIHTMADFQRMYSSAEKVGFRNINVDLMSSLPGQSLDSWRRTLETVTDLKPNHISAYSLIIEEGTPFYERYREDEMCRENGGVPKYLPDEETERSMYALTGQLLAQKGYRRYEISNYALPGYECRHNIGYWIRRNYIGLGLGAASLYDRTRWKNPENLERYISWYESGSGQIREEEELLSRTEEMEETMFLGLRLMRGVSVRQFAQRFEENPLRRYAPQIEKCMDLGLIAPIDRKDPHIRLTEKGIDVSNQVMAEFLEG